MPVIKMPDGKKVRFPDDMPRENILEAIKLSKGKMAANHLTESLKIRPNNIPSPAKWTDVVKDFGTGFIEGTKLGTEEFMNSASLGFYDWLNKKTGGDFRQRTEENQQMADAAGMGGLNRIAKFDTNIAGALLGAPAKIWTGMGKLGLSGIKQAAAAGAVEGGLSNVIAADDAKKIIPAVASGVIEGSIGGIGGELAGRGVGNIIQMIAPKATAAGQTMKRLKNVFSAQELKKIADKASSTGRSILETGDEDVVVEALRAKQQSRKAAKMLVNKAQELDAKQSDRNLGVINSIFGPRTKSQNTDYLIKTTRDKAAPIYNELNNIGDLEIYEIAQKLRGLPAAERTRLDSSSWDDAADILREQAKEAGVTLEGDIRHFLTPDRRPFVDTLANTYKNPDVKANTVSPRGDLPTTYIMKKYKGEPKPLYDLLISRRDGSIYNKIPTTKERYIAKNMTRKKNVSDTPTDVDVRDELGVNPTSEQYAGPVDEIPTYGRTQNVSGVSPSSEHNSILSGIGKFVKDNDYLQKEIKRVKKDVAIPKDVRNAADTDFRILDYVKKNIDDDISVAKREGNTNRVALLESNKKNLLEKMDSIVPIYKEGRGLYEAEHNILRAQKIGESILDAKNSPEDLARAMREMSPADRQGLVIGAREKIANTVGSKNNETLGMKSLLSKNVQDKLRLILGRKAASRLTDHAQTEVNAMRNINKVLGGSQTHEKFGIENDTELAQKILMQPYAAAGVALKEAFNPATKAQAEYLVELLTDKGGKKFLKEIDNQLYRDKMSEILGAARTYLGSSAARKIGE